eukprot:c38959_g1_i1 orf=1-234(-)
MVWLECEWKSDLSFHMLFLLGVSLACQILLKVGHFVICKVLESQMASQLLLTRDCLGSIDVLVKALCVRFLTPACNCS